MIAIVEAEAHAVHRLASQAPAAAAATAAWAAAEYAALRESTARSTSWTSENNYWTAPRASGTYTKGARADRSPSGSAESEDRAASGAAKPKRTARSGRK